MFDYWDEGEGSSLTLSCSEQPCTSKSVYGKKLSAQSMYKKKVIKMFYCLGKLPKTGLLLSLLEKFIPFRKKSVLF
jgi:hypothetical protein